MEKPKELCYTFDYSKNQEIKIKKALFYKMAFNKYEKILDNTLVDEKYYFTANLNKIIKESKSIKK